jgi:hypothetical protein
VYCMPQHNQGCRHSWWSRDHVRGSKVSH